MKKKTTRNRGILLIICVVIVVCTIVNVVLHNTQKETNPLKQIVLSEDYSEYVCMSFDIYDEEQIYVDENSNIFFTLPECREEDEIEDSADIKFISSKKILGYNMDGFSVYALLTVDNQVVYCLSSTPVKLVPAD